ncbi:MAG: site-specific integrase [Solirubrobacterales bacterium]|nr:site-specific integrase [Solirubrobacterales bacterium]
MAAKHERTRTPGIYRRGSRYVVAYRDPEGVQRRESTRTLDDARNLKRERERAVKAGSYQAPQRLLFGQYATEWIGEYQGQGQRGFKEATRDDYLRDLNRYIVPNLGHLPVSAIRPSHIRKLVKWLESEDEQGKLRAEERRSARAASEGVEALSLPLEVKPTYLADATIKRILAPLRACLATARGDNLIGHNPADRIALSPRDEQHRIDTGTDTDELVVKALTTDELSLFLDCCPERWRLFFDVLAATGIRVSESFALRWRDLRLEGSDPVLKVRRAYVKGRFGPPKSRAGRRDIPLPLTVTDDLKTLRQRTEGLGESGLVFPARNGAPLRQENVRRRALVPTAKLAGVGWIGFHTFRHTCATRLFAAGRNAVQVQRWLGHASPAFTLSVYTHLLDDDLGGALDAPMGGNRVVTTDTDTARIGTQPEAAFPH